LAAKRHGGGDEDVSGLVWRTVLFFGLIAGYVLLAALLTSPRSFAKILNRAAAFRRARASCAMLDDPAWVAAGSASPRIIGLSGLTPWGNR